MSISSVSRPCTRLSYFRESNCIPNCPDALLKKERVAAPKQFGSLRVQMSM